MKLETFFGTIAVILMATPAVFTVIVIIGSCFGFFKYKPKPIPIESVNWKKEGF